MSSDCHRRNCLTDVAYNTLPDLSSFFSLTVLVSQITQVLEGKSTKTFEKYKIPDEYKVGVFNR